MHVQQLFSAFPATTCSHPFVSPLFAQTSLPPIRAVFPELFSSSNPPSYQGDYRTGSEEQDGKKRKATADSNPRCYKQVKQTSLPSPNFILFPLENEIKVPIQITHHNTHLKLKLFYKTRARKWTFTELETYLKILRAHAILSLKDITKIQKNRVKSHGIRVHLYWDKIARDLNERMRSTDRTLKSCYDFFISRQLKNILPSAFYTGGQVRIKVQDDSLKAYEKVNQEWKSCQKNLETLPLTSCTDHMDSQKKARKASLPFLIETLTFFQEGNQEPAPPSVCFLHHKARIVTKVQQRIRLFWNSEELEAYLGILRKLTYQIFIQAVNKKHSHALLDEGESISLHLDWEKFANKLTKKSANQDKERSPKACYMLFKKIWVKVLPSVFYAGGAVKVEIWKKSIKAFYRLQGQWQEYKTIDQKYKSTQVLRAHPGNFI